MVILDDKPYKLAKQIVLGKNKPNLIGQGLSDYLKTKYGIYIVNYEYSQVDDNYRLDIIVYSSDDYDKLHKSRFVNNPTIEKAVRKIFLKLCSKYSELQPFSTETFFVSYYNLQHESITDANWQTFDKYHQKLENKFNAIWKVDALFEQLVVFYPKEEDIEKNFKNGISHDIKNQYVKWLSKYDDLGYIKSDDDFNIRFDSKENLDKNYSGSLFNYSR